MQEPQERWIWSQGQEDSLEEKMVTSPVFLSGKFQGQRSLMGYSPWGLKKVRWNWARMHNYNLFLSSSRQEYFLTILQTFKPWHLGFQEQSPHIPSHFCFLSSGKVSVTWLRLLVYSIPLSNTKFPSGFILVCNNFVTHGLKHHFILWVRNLGRIWLDFFFPLNYILFSRVASNGESTF